MAERFIEINTDGLQGPKVGDGLFENRSAVAEQMQQTAASEVSIIIQAYGRLEKTKRCVESVLKYTVSIDYELILIDNGSTDGTLEYFRSIPWEKKTILHVTQNIGAGYPSLMLGLGHLGQYVCILGSDVIVTHNWLDNLLACLRSDLRIGMVVPVSSNVSNLQEVNLSFKSYEEMQPAAKRFNQPDPKKWEERLRLITVAALYRKEVLLAVGWPLADSGFFHDFVDDDVSFAVRRAGYRTMVAGDAWVCHDHDFRHSEGKNPAEFEQSMRIGRENFQEKYYGLDAWEDVNNFYSPYLDCLPYKEGAVTVRILGVDVRCGTPVLDVKNRLRKHGTYQAELSAFTQDAKYWLDLKTVCQGPVICDREEFLADSFPREYFDYVVADRPLNRYHEPQKMMNDLFALCKKGGVVLCKVQNTFSFREYIHLLGQRDVYADEFSYNIPFEIVQTALNKLGTVRHMLGIPFSMPSGQRELLESLLPAAFSSAERTNIVNRMCCQELMLFVEKA